MTTNNHDLTTIGARMAWARRMKGVTQADVARVLDQEKQSVSQYERDRRTPAPHILARAAEYLGVSLEWMTTGQGEPRRATSSSTHIANEPRDEYDVIERTVNTHIGAVDQYVLPVPVYEPMDTNGKQHYAVVRDRREMERAYGDSARAVRRRYMTGDAMRRSIMPGAEIDCIPVEEYQGPGLYYMHLDGRPLIARLQPIGGGGWLIKYDSDDYDDEMLVPDDEGTFTSRLSGLTVDLRVHERVGGYRVTS